jgi:CRISPR-associated protein Csb2
MMFAIGIRYLCGRAVATHPADRASPEWPPHPDRVFMALAAAYFETGASPGERSALEWLEGLAPPALSVSEGNSRNTVTSYVPVNDDSNPVNEKTNKPHMISGTLSIGRGRQPRVFPTVVPESETLYLIWQDAEPSVEYSRDLETLCGKVTYLGHSSSPVQMWAEAAPPRPTLAPVDGHAPCRLRVTGAGRLAALAACFEAGRRPSASLWSGYAQPARQAPGDTTARTIFSDNLIILRRVNGPALPLESTLVLTEAMRGAVMARCPQPPPEWISGHCADGSRSEQDHLAILPLPYVGYEHSDGHLLGVAVAVPRHVADAEVARCLAPLLAPVEIGESHLVQLTMGSVGVWGALLEEREQPPAALHSRTWTRLATRWASVTPIVLDRYPKVEGDAEAAIATACARIGLPLPVDVVVMPVSLFIGAPRASAYAPLLSKTGARRWHAHALVTFAEPVRGPVLLGAGRYRGYGLCRPYSA